MEFQDALLNGVGTDETADGDVFVLPDAVGAVGGLVFRGGIPPWIQQDDVIRSGEVEPHAAGLERDEEEISLSLLEDIHQYAASGSGGAAVQIQVGEVFFLKQTANVLQHIGKLAEDEGAVSAGLQFRSQFPQGFQFGGGGQATIRPPPRLRAAALLLSAYPQSAAIKPTSSSLISITGGNPNRAISAGILQRKQSYFNHLFCPMTPPTRKTSSFQIDAFLHCGQSGMMIYELHLLFYHEIFNFP